MYSLSIAFRVAAKIKFHTVPHLPQQIGSTAIFNHVGDAIVVAHQTEHTVRVMDIPTMKVIESPAAHVGGCVALALDPRGRQVYFSASH